MNFTAAGVPDGRVSTTRLWKRMKARWVCATARFSSFRGSGMRPSDGVVARARQVEAVVGVRVGSAGLQVKQIGLVELRGVRIVRPMP